MKLIAMFLALCLGTAMGEPPPDAVFQLVVRDEPTALDYSEDDLPASCPKLLRCSDTFFVEVWVTSPDGPGISCASVDLVSHIPVGEVGIEYGTEFNAGSAFEMGEFLGDGSVVNLNACNLQAGGIGVWPEWVLLARVELQQDYRESVAFELTEPTLPQLGTSMYGQGFADPVDYGDRCSSRIMRLPKGRSGKLERKGK